MSGFPADMTADPARPEASAVNVPPAALWLHLRSCFVIPVARANVNGCVRFVMGDVENYARFQAADAIRDAASNPGGAGEGMGLGVGMAMG
ncbi:hypothetical protein AB0M26_30960, partial [Streptomyces sp. NPDC051776]